jgi:hypothetical protein
MNKATRLLAMTGMAVAAGLTMSAGPASAASATPAPGPGHDRVQGYFGNPIACQRAGRVGELRDRWDDHDCNKVRFGLHRGQWALLVSWNSHHGPFGHGHGPRPIHGPGPFHHGHGPVDHHPSQHGSDQHGSDQHGSDQHGSDQHGSDQHGSDQHGSDHHSHN